MKKKNTRARLDNVLKKNTPSKLDINSVRFIENVKPKIPIFCICGSGRVDAHMTYVECSDEREMFCTFCGKDDDGKILKEKDLRPAQQFFEKFKDYISPVDKDYLKFYQELTNWFREFTDNMSFNQRKNIKGWLIRSLNVDSDKRDES